MNAKRWHIMTKGADQRNINCHLHLHRNGKGETYCVMLVNLLPAIQLIRSHRCLIRTVTPDPLRRPAVACESVMQCGGCEISFGFEQLAVMYKTSWRVGDQVCSVRPCKLLPTVHIRYPSHLSAGAGKSSYRACYKNSEVCSQCVTTFEDEWVVIS